MKTNKEVIDALVKYFMTQDPEVIARCLANSMIDIKRFYMPHNCNNDEWESLMLRTNKNLGYLKKFTEDGPDGDLKLIRIEDVANHENQ